MRILSVGNMYPPHHLGGYELAWESWVGRARPRGHTVRVLTTDFQLESGPGQADDEARDVHRDLRWYWRDHEFPRLRPIARWALERHNARALERHLRELRPDVVVWWAMGGMSLGLMERVRRRGLPSVAMVCDDWLVYAPTVDAWTRAFARRPRVARLAEPLLGATTRVELGPGATWLFLSDALRRRAVAKWPTVAGSEVVHRGPDADFRQVVAPPWRWRLLYAGRIDRRKGIDTAVRALDELPKEATLRVDGGGDTDHLVELERLAREHGVEDRVVFGRSARAELPAMYANADVIVFPVRWAEPWGLVPLEAMAVGRPVVATGLGGSAEYLEDGENCLLFNPTDSARALAERVRSLAGDPALRERLRDGGLRTAGSLSAERFNARVLAAVERAGGVEPAAQGGSVARLGA